MNNTPKKLTIISQLCRIFKKHTLAYLANRKRASDTIYVLIFKTLQCQMSSKDEIDTKKIYTYCSLGTTQQKLKNHFAIVPNLQ